MMPMIRRRVQVGVIASSLAAAVAVAAQNLVPPVKPGLWQTKISQLDANGKEVPSPELAMLSRMPADARAQMAAAMKARGVQLPDEHGMMKACLTNETLSSGAWQQVAAGCTTTYAVRSNSAWKWHSSCPALKSESDGEMTFKGAEAYHTRVTTTATSPVTGKTTTSTRIVDGTWLGAACGDVQPTAPPPARGR
jgi:hypothetical protein